MNSSKMPLHDPTITHQLFQLITEMSEDEKHTLLELLKGGTLKGKSRRQHFRKPLHIPVRCTNKAGVSIGFTQDISLGGLFIILNRGVFSLGQILWVSFSPPSIEKTVWITADVMRITPEGIGVRFRSMDEVQKTAVISVASMQ